MLGGGPEKKPKFPRGSREKTKHPQSIPSRSKGATKLLLSKVQENKKPRWP